VGHPAPKTCHQQSKAGDDQGDAAERGGNVTSAGKETGSRAIAYRPELLREELMKGGITVYGLKSSRAPKERKPKAVPSVA